MLVLQTKTQRIYELKRSVLERLGGLVLRVKLFVTSNSNVKIFKLLAVYKQTYFCVFQNGKNL